MASGCKQLTTLNLGLCSKITDEALVTVTSRCPLLTKLTLAGCRNITDAAVVTVASGRPLLTMITTLYTTPYSPLTSCVVEKTCGTVPQDH